MVILQQQRQVLPRREGVARKVQERIERLIAANAHSVALQRQPEHPDNAQHACSGQHPQRNPAANNADKQEDGKRDYDIGARPAHNHIGQQTKRDGAHQEEQPRFAVLTQEINHQHGRNEEVEETLQSDPRDFAGKNLAIGLQSEQQESVVHKEDAHAHQRNRHQDNPGQMGFNAIDGKQRPARLTLYSLTQSRFIRHVVDGIETGC